MKLIGMVLLVAGMAGAALGQSPVPEVGPGYAVSAVALLCGTLLVVKGRRKK